MSRPWRLLAAVLAASLVAAGVTRFAARKNEAEAGARWIWAEVDPRVADPIAFYAARDVELATPGPARVAIAADESYVLYVNGQRVGTGSFRPEAGLDLFDVTDFLDAGINRLVVEARSSRRAGGLLARLELPDGVIVTDRRWRIFRRHDPGMLRGWSNLEDGEAPRIWAPAPTGRWRLEGTRPRPIPFQVFPPPERRPPIRQRLHHSDAWSPLDPERRVPTIGPQQVFDWGAEVTGYLSFDLRSDDGLPGLLYVSTEEPPDPTVRPPDAVILPVPGRAFWQDAHARMFRYALLVGAEPYSRVEVDLLDGETADVVADSLAPPKNRLGVFGIEPPRSYSTVAELVWGRLEDEAEATAE